ncbi:hypothetical protein HDU98_007702 [Podochytrium sp. JEL0797]|nr:hypothetical protein HDU98_007702 [Podochytrium sp. JEL0797]
MKKAVFTIMHHLMPLRNILSLHSSANESLHDPTNVSLFFGLSGTGKTTLSASPTRRLIGDDEHCWSNDGIFNIEGGCYAKAIHLSAETEPEIFSAIRFGTILENVVLDPETREVDFNDKSITENTRVCYPLHFIPNAKIPSVATHPRNIIFLTCDAYGVLPPVSLLTNQQASFHFLAGYTSKVAGTEQGVVGHPVATFSACFGAPFLVHSPAVYADLLAEKLAMHPDCRVWLVNTGWVGGPVGIGNRIALKVSRAIVDAIHDGSLVAGMEGEESVVPVFGLRIPTKGVAGVPNEVLDPLNAWKLNGRTEVEYLEALQQLMDRFEKNGKEDDAEKGRMG